LSKLSAKTNQINVLVKGLGNITAAAGISLEALIAGLQLSHELPVVAGIVNNRLRDLNFLLDRDCEVEMVELYSEAGLKIYRRSASFLLLKACKDLFPERRLMIKHTLSNGTYCEFLDETINNVEVEQIARRMQEIVEADLPIQRKRLPKQQAQELLARQGKPDTVKILAHRDKEEVHIYELDGFYEYFLRLHGQPYRSLKQIQTNLLSADWFCRPGTQ
jgi:uridine kinase